jgi:hypothetical protein
MSSVNDVDYSFSMPYMWADTLQAAERAHLLRLLIWSAGSIVAGTAVIAWLRASALHSQPLKQFAVQCLAWGTVEAAIGIAMLIRLAPRDVASATRLDRLLWLSIGLDVGYLLIGGLLVILGRLGKRPGMIGAGMAVIVQGGALVLLDLILAAQISR